MFEDSLVESKWEKTHRSSTVFISTVIHLAVAVGLLLLPLMTAEVALPTPQMLTFLVMPPPEMPPPPPPPAIVQPRPTAVAAVPVITPRPVTPPPAALIAPREIPKDIKILADSAPLNPGEVIGRVPTGFNNGTLNGVLGSHETLAAAPPPPPPPPPAAPTPTPNRIRQGGNVQQAMLVDFVKPSYPILARQARVQGSVVLEAVIGKDGTVAEIRVMSGHPFLRQAAIDAVRQWRYKPTLLNGVPVEVLTTITVNFGSHP